MVDGLVIKIFEILYSFFFLSIYLGTFCLVGTSQGVTETVKDYPINICYGSKSYAVRCIDNDSDCGLWDLENHTWHPHGCSYRQINVEQARKCVGERVLGFVGDSQVRDLGVAMGLFLSNTTLPIEYKNVKYDHHGDISKLTPFGYNIPEVDFWKPNVKNGNNGVFFPSNPPHDWKWQVQVYELYNADLNHAHIHDVLWNLMPIKGTSMKMPLRNISIAFWNYGLHEHSTHHAYKRYRKPDFLPYNSSRYINEVIGFYIKVRSEHPPVPTIWVSMNNNWMDFNSYSTKYDPEDQGRFVEESNRKAHKLFAAHGLPYWDAAEVLRTGEIASQREHLMADTVHLKMWVDTVRVKMLLSRLCNSDSEWIGTEDDFIDALLA